jgi:glycosyltransferase involved in cell wall biosynthesis
LFQEKGVELLGLLESLRPTYTNAAFAVNPVLAGTGQQVKIVDAMAHGLPVVALSNTAANSPLRHGVNGFLARNAEEFAEYVLALWNDRALCRRLGQAARETISAEYSSEILRKQIGDILNLARSGS